MAIQDESMCYDHQATEDVGAVHRCRIVGDHTLNLDMRHSESAITDAK